jgi:hypothetical protein
MGTPAVTAEETRPPADWRRASEGIQLAGFAVFLLLNTTGKLPWSFWIDAIALWPVLIMAAGLRMAVDRTRFPWLQLLSPALVLGALTWLAFAQRPLLPVRDWQTVSVASGAGVEKARIEGSLLGTRLFAASGKTSAGVLAEGRMASRRGTARLHSEVDGAAGTIRLEGPRKGGPFLWMPGASDHWDLVLAETLPLTVKIGGAMSRVALDLRRGRLEHGAVEGVGFGTDLQLPAPEKDTEFRIAGVFNAVTITVPVGTPVRVHGPGLPFNLVNRRTIAGEGPGYDIHVAGIFSAATLDTRPATPEDRPAAPRPSPPSATRPPAEEDHRR